MLSRKICLMITTVIMISGIMGCNVKPVGETSMSSIEVSTSSTPLSQKVGISMPTKDLARCKVEGLAMKQQLEEAGYLVDLRFAGDNEPDMQIKQIESMTIGDCDLLIISAIDGSSLTNALKPAKDKGIPVIAYSRLIMDTDAVSYYVTFPQWGETGLQAGILQGEFIEKALELQYKENPINIEIFLGDVYDNPGSAFANGMMEAIQPYIDSGKMRVPSGQVEILEVSIDGWRTDKAKERMNKLISSQKYGPKGKRLDAIWCPNDSIAQGVTQVLLDAGYTADNFPIITGMDCEIESVKNILAGTQSMSVWGDTRMMAAKTSEMAQSILNGEKPEVNETEMYDNGTGKIPTYVCDFVICTRENYRDLLIDSGYYTEEDLMHLPSEK